MRFFSPRTVLQRQKIEAQEQPMNYENAKNFEGKKILIQLSPFSRKHLVYSVPIGFVVELCGYAHQYLTYQILS